MFILYGTKPFKRVIGRLSADTPCPNCQRPANWEILRVVSFFTLFFIPLFPYGVRYYLVCSHCEAGQKIRKKAAMELLAGSKNNHSRTGQPPDICDLSVSEEELNPSDLYEAYTYRLPVEQMIKAENKFLLKSYAIFTVAAILMFLIFISGSYLWISLILLACTLLMLFIVLPAHTFKLLVINRKRAPHIIHMNYNSLRFDSQSIPSSFW